LKLLNRKNKISFFIIISIITIAFLNYKIKTDLSYHAGKDGGYFKRLESIIVLSISFYIIVSRNVKILYGFIGFIVSILSTIVGLMISSFLQVYLLGDTILHLFIFSISYSSFFIIEKIMNRNFKNLKSNT